jgi:hypothetical protein
VEVAAAAAAVTLLLLLLLPAQCHAASQKDLQASQFKRQAATLLNIQPRCRKYPGILSLLYSLLRHLRLLMQSYWSGACSSATQRPFSELITTMNAVRSLVLCSSVQALALPQLMRFAAPSSSPHTPFLRSQAA